MPLLAPTAGGAGGKVKVLGRLQRREAAAVPVTGELDRYTGSGAAIHSGAPSVVYGRQHPGRGSHPSYPRTLGRRPAR